MKPWLEKGAVTLYHGDALETLRGLPDSSVQMIASSPPFWGLRDYGTGRWEGGDADCDHLGEPKANINANTGTGSDVKNAADRQPFKSTCGKCGARRVDSQIGLEETPDQWVERLVAVYRECRRVLRDDGCMFIEIGDSYVSGQGGRQSAVGELPPSTRSDRTEPQDRPDLPNPPAGWSTRQAATRTYPQRDTGMKPKDLVGQPWLLAFALRADGWYLRSEIIWSRPNPMPESVTDRPTKAHSTVFLLSKRARYYYDADAIREPYIIDGRKITTVKGTDASEQHRDGERWPNPVGANARSVWSIATEPTPFAHFATWPQTLIERMIRAGTSERGACEECGSPWVRVVERSAMVVRPAPKRAAWQATGDDFARTQIGGTVEESATSRTIGWEASCLCGAAVVPCVCLDPFMGSGTTALVARRLSRHVIGIELNEEYLGIARGRLSIPDEEGEVAKTRFAIEGQRGFDFDV